MQANEIKMDIAENLEYFGKMITKWTPDLKNKYVITGFLSGKENTTNNRVGRVVQVRLEAGDYGSDCVLLRHKDNLLVPHTNQCFWLIPDRFKDYLDEIFKDAQSDKPDEYTYTLQEKEPKKGFIIKSPFKRGESTPMRDIKKAIANKLEEIL
jgi:hypothetical protein